MTSATAVSATILQMQRSWHDGGLFVGMHWLWWLFWIGALLVLVWALWRSASDDRATHRRTVERESAEEALRRRFAEGEIDEEEFKKRMQVLGEFLTGI